MPTEQGHFGERAARNSSSKNAKNRSNSATLRASQCGIHREQSGMAEMRNRIMHCGSEKDSEKDSGYSEAGSESVNNNDLDDQRSNVSEPHRERRKNSCNKSGNSADCNLPPYEEPAPIYVIKNLVVKPSRPEQLLHGSLAWGGGWHNLTNAKAASTTQLLLIQQPSSNSSSSTPTTASSLASRQGHVKKGGSRNSSNLNHGGKNSYLPILNSYPRIAPHPRKESNEGKGASKWEEGVKESGGGGGGGGEGHSQSKRVCIEEENREAVSTTTTSHLQKVHSHSQYKGKGGHSTSHCTLLRQTSSTTNTTQHRSHQYQPSSDSVGSPSISSSQALSPPSSSSNSNSSSSSSSSSPSSSAAHSPRRLMPDSLSTSDTRHRRFLNTAEILNQSGLLAITLRTKELLKQNEAMDREIAQLRQHTQLLCQIAQVNPTGCNKGLGGLDKLLQSMTDSDSYLNLDVNSLKAHTSSSHQLSETREEEDKERDTKTTTSNATEVVSLLNIDDGASPPSPLFAPSPDTVADLILGPMSPSFNLSYPRSVPPEQGHGQAVIDQNFSDLTTLSESPLHTNYLL